MFKIICLDRLAHTLFLVWEGHELWPPVLPLIGLRDNADHTRRRKPWSRAFSSAALKNYEPLIAKRCSQFIELLVEKKQVDFTHWAHLFTCVRSLEHTSMVASYLLSQV